MRWKVTHLRGDRLRFTDRTCANFMSALVYVGGQVVETKFLGNAEQVPQTKKFFTATIQLPTEKKIEFELISGLKLKHEQHN